MIRACIFDLGNVLVGFDIARGYRALAPHCRCSPAGMPGLILESGLVRPFERGEMSGEEFFRQLGAVLGLEVSYEKFCELWGSIFLPDPLVTDDLLAALRRGYRMVLLSNTNEIHFRMIQRNYTAVAHFDAHILSCRVGAMKQAGEMYRQAVRQAGCEPSECFYTNDVEEFVEGGRRCGLDAVQFRGAAQLEAELRRRGML